MFSEAADILKGFLNVQLSIRGIEVDAELSQKIQSVLDGLSDKSSNTFGGRLQAILDQNSATVDGKVAVFYSGILSDGIDAFNSANSLRNSNPDRYYLAGDTALAKALNSNLTNSFVGNLVQNNGFSRMEILALRGAFDRATDALLSERFSAQASEAIGIFGNLRESPDRFTSSVFEGFEAERISSGILFNNEIVEEGNARAKIEQVTESSAKALEFLNDISNNTSLRIDEILGRLDIFRSFDLNGP